MIVRELVALFGFQVDEQSVKAVESRLESLKNFVGGAVAVGAFVTAGQTLVGFAEEVANIGDELMGMSAQLGISTRDLQEFRYLGEMANVSSQDMAASLRFLSKNSFEAANGNKELAASFVKLGVDVHGANGAVKPSADLLLEMADAFSATEDPAKRTALASKLLGDAGAKLIPFLSQGSAAIREQRKELEELGAVMSDELIGVSDEFSDNQTKMQRAMLGIKIAVAQQLLPALNRINGAFIQWFKQDGARFRKALADVAEFLGNILELASKVTTAILDFITGADSIQKMFLAGAAGAGLFAAALSNPIVAFGIFIALILLIIEDIYVWQTGGKSLFGTMIAGFKQMWEELKKGLPILKLVETIFVGIGKAVEVVKNLVFTLFSFLGAETQQEGVRLLGDGLKRTFLDFLDADDWKKEQQEAFNRQVVGSIATMPLVPLVPTKMGSSSAPSNSMTNTVSIQVDATGATDPRGVADEVGRAMDNWWEDKVSGAAQYYRNPATAGAR